VRLRPIEAATIVREVALQVARGDVAGMPSPHVIRIAASGAVSIEGPVGAGGHLVSRAAQLLDSLLPPFDSAPEYRAPGALRLVTARALGTLDLPAYPSLESFAAALTRFAAPDSVALLRDLATTWSEAIATQHQPRSAENDDPLSISDIRRARRATGVTLAEVSDRSRIPVSLLRQLEWGYLRNWPSGHYGRTQLVRYARAAGLDAELVVQAAWPLIQEIERQPEAARPEELPVAAGRAAAETASDGEMVAASRTAPEWDWSDIPAGVLAAPVPRRSRTSARWAAALAIPALLAIGVFIPRAWRPEPPAPTDVGVAVERGAPSPVDAEPAQAPALDHNAPAQTMDRSARAAAPRPADTAPQRADAAAPQLATVAAPVELSAHERAFSPTFASEGSAMFYHAEADGRSALMRADTDSRGAVLRVTSIVNDRARNFHVRPSPDGARIAFDSDREGERAVYVADADGRNVTRVSGEGFAAVPSWSPDGRKLAFVRGEADRPRVWNLWSVDLEAGEKRQLTSHRVGQAWGGSWFPDGQRIAYSHESQLVVLDLNNLSRRVYPAPRPGLLRTPAVSPDGRRVMFQIHRDGAWMLDLKDGSMRKVLSDPTAEEFTWAPDGRRVAYHSRRTGNWGVWVMMAR
jgi:hypothetical protein